MNGPVRLDPPDQPQELGSRPDLSLMQTRADHEQHPRWDVKLGRSLRGVRVDDPGNRHAQLAGARDEECIVAPHHLPVQPVKVEVGV